MHRSICICFFFPLPLSTTYLARNVRSLCNIKGNATLQLVADIDFLKPDDQWSWRYEVTIRERLARFPTPASSQFWTSRSGNQEILCNSGTSSCDAFKSSEVVKGSVGSEVTGRAPAPLSCHRPLTFLDPCLSWLSAEPSYLRLSAHTDEREWVFSGPVYIHTFVYPNISSPIWMAPSLTFLGQKEEQYAALRCILSKSLIYLRSSPADAFVCVHWFRMTQRHAELLVGLGFILALWIKQI